MDFAVLSVISIGVSGIIGNFADRGFCQILEEVRQRLQQEEPPVNYDLQKAARKAYLQATRAVCLALYQLWGVAPETWRRSPDYYIGRRPKLYCLDKVQNILNQELQQLPTAKSIPHTGTEEQVKRLLQQGDSSNQDFIEELRSALKENLLRELEDRHIALPKDFPKMVHEGWEEGDSHLDWFDFVCAFFAEELKTNERVRAIFQSQLLAELKADNQSFTISLENLQAGLEGLNQNLAQRFHQIDLKLEELCSKIEDIAELKQQLENLLPQLVLQLDQTETILKTIHKGKVDLPDSYTDSNSKNFTGREEYLQQLKDLLLPEQPKNGSNIVVIHGIPAVGKSTLAYKFAEDNRQKFPGGIYDIQVSDLQITNQKDIGWRIANWILQRSGKDKIDKNNYQNLDEVIKTYFNEQHLLLIIDVDNFDVDKRFSNDSYIRKTKHLSHSGLCSIIITSRSKSQEIEDKYQVKLEVFNSQEAVDFLIKSVSKKESQRKEIESNRDIAEQIVEEVGRLPLAIKNLGINLTDDFYERESLCKYCNELKETKSQFVNLYSGQNAQVNKDESVWASFFLSIKILKTAESIAFFASLGVCSKNGFSLSLASTIFYDERQVKNNERQVKNNFLRALHRISFIDHLNHDGDGEAYKQRYKITHPLIHEFSKDMLNGDLNELLKDIINLEDYITLAQAKQRHAKYFVDLVNEQVISDINDNENLSIITKRQLKIRCLGKIVNLYFYNNKIKNKFEEAKNYLRNISTIANNIKIENNVDLFPEDLVPELLLKIYYARLYFSKAKAEDFKHENSRQWVRKAKKICEKAVKNLGNKLRKYDESQQHKQLLYIDIVLGQLGEYCLWLGRLESEGPNKRSNFENARKYLEISCKINDECKNLHGSSLTLKNLGITYKELMNLEEDEVEKGHLFDQAKEKLLESYFINKELNDNKVPDQSWALIELFDLYISQNKDLYEIINEIIKNESDENLNKTEKLIETICKNLKYPMKGKVIVFNNESQFSFIKSDKGKVKKILNYDYGFITSECLPGKKIYFDIKRNNFDSLDQDQVVEFKVNYLPNNPPDYKWRANIDLVGDPTANGQKTTLRV